ncbi:hypothetical protein GV054_11850 [Marinomonas mediterranea]|uniref:hypothetical protein n=1 Tax=Marinomonas mediterranea TaxID=119864 RepID=UPI00234A2402|nr:hypothetical protein [Marinomonas mediterranea]WCN13644.1 hypothetical protein GV054_11850 [Marinomonas mediterranea]
MRGQFRSEVFDQEKLSSFIKQLHEAGITCDVEWNRGLSRTVKERANGLKLKYDNKTFFKQQGVHGDVIAEHLPPEQRDIFLTKIKNAGLYNEPVFFLSALLSLVFLGILVGLVLPEFLRRSETLAITIVSLMAIMFIGYALLYRAAGPNALENSLILPTLLTIPGLLCCAPSSVLLTPLGRTILKRSLYSQIHNLPSDIENRTQSDSDDSSIALKNS